MNNNTLSIKDDSFTKTEDESSLSDGIEANLTKTLSASYFSFENVRFTPKIIEFVDAFEGKQFSVKIIIQNVGRNPVLVKVGEPNSFIFQLKKPSRRAKLLAAGASITKTVTYTYHNVDLIQKSQIPVQIDGHLVDYPIVVKKAVPDIEIQPQKLDFKTINLGATAKTMVLTIHNKGGRRTKFKIDLGKNDLDLVVNPMRGTIKAKSQVKIFLEMMGFSEGEYYHEIWIKTNELPIRVPVLVTVVRPRLEIVFPNGTEDFTLIAFKPTFNGTQKAQPFLLKNCSTDSTLFNTLGEVNGELQVLKNARSSTNAFNMFMITTEEGRLEPFESRVFTVIFRPKAVATRTSWQHKDDEKKGNQWEHIVFLRINRIHRIERKELAKIDFSPSINQRTPQEKNGTALRSLSDLPLVSYTKINRTFDYAPEIAEESTGRRSNFFTESSLPEEKVLRLCLHGNSVEPDILIQPSGFDFGEISLGQSENKVLRITNKTTIPVKCKLCKTMNLKTTPTEIWLRNEKSHEFFLSLTPKCAGKFKTKLMIQILAESDVVFDSDKAFETVAVYTVILNYTAKDTLTVPVPKIGLGITPLITDEVGLQKDLVTFKDAFKYPSAAVLGLKQGFKTTWMKVEKDKLNNVDNAIIALPNDRPRGFYIWPKNKICRTIFSGFFRYSPPEDLTYTLSLKERNKKKEQYEIWSNYITLLKELRKANCSNLGELKNQVEYNVSCKKHYNAEQIKIDPITKNSKSKWKCKKSGELLEYIFVPLSPTSLSNVSVEPKLINFNKVAVNTIVQESICINNMNTFPISIKFVPGKSAVSILERDKIIIQPSASKYVQVIFQTKDLGRYFGFLNYVINESHEFKITISAFVTSKTLTLGDNVINFELRVKDPKEAFQPRSTFLPIQNLLQSTVKYRWNSSPDSAFFINVTEGEIPPRSSLLAEIIFDAHPKKSFYSEITLLSESGHSESVKLVHPSRKVAVNFLSNRIDMQDIPLNLLTKTKAVIQNACYHDVCFDVLDANPIPGITIEPTQGLIKARSFFPLEIKVQIPVIMKFSFSVVLIVHFTNKIFVKITGNVVLPVIRMKPSEVVLRKICAQSFDIAAICVENIGTTTAEVNINFKNCPEYRVTDGSDKISLSPKQSAKFFIRFEPKDIARYVFYVPVIVNNILGPPEMQEPQTEFVHFYISKFESLYDQHGEVFNSVSSGLKIPCVCLNSTVSQSLVNISSLNLNFELEPKSNTKFQPQQIVFSNNCSNDVTFCIRNDDLGESNDSPFNMIPVAPGSVENRIKSMKAQLSRGEKLVLKATFEPKKPGSYSVDVPIFVRGYSSGLVYNFINLKGELKSPRIFTEISEIHFPPLPLDVGSEVTVLVCAENYRVPDTINCILCDFSEGNGDSEKQYFMTKWLTEPVISQFQRCHSFQLLINFRSSVPVAVKNYILLFDSTGTYSSIYVTAIADNSIATTHAFLSTRYIKYRLIRDELPRRRKADDLLGFPVNKNQLKALEKNLTDKQTDSKTNSGFLLENSESKEDSNGNLQGTSNKCSLQIDKGPRLVIQESKSISRSTQMSFINVTRNLTDCRGGSSTYLFPTKSKLLTSLSSKSESIIASRLSNFPISKRADWMSDITYPNFPVSESIYEKHFNSTLKYVERWMFEVVMRCDQSFSIPSSFQNLTEQEKRSKISAKSKAFEQQEPKDFLDFLEEILGKDFDLSKWSVAARADYPANKAIRLRSIFADILRLLESFGCFLPHIKPEHLMDYENYVLYTKEVDNIETFTWKSFEREKINSTKVEQDVVGKVKFEKEGIVRRSSSVFSARESWKKSLFEGYMQASEIEVDKMEDKSPAPNDSALNKRNSEPHRDLVLGKQFLHQIKVLGKTSFDLKSTQAWLDIVTQIFKTFVLKRIILKRTIPQVSVIEMCDKIPVETVEINSIVYNSKRNKEYQDSFNEDSCISNVYSTQERILLDWLNHHCQVQEKSLWGNESETGSLVSKKVIDNFDKDLSDSIALISVTASHCPYIVSEYFDDVFAKPDTPNKTHHNAGKLIQAWRTLKIGLSVETSDIVQPNPVFMIILVTHLYEVLPSLHPHSLICFSTALNTEITRVIQIKNDFKQRIFYKVTFFGENDGIFRLNNSSVIELKPQRTTNINVVFEARKIKRTSATLLLSGCSMSPNFAHHLVFYLEGHPSKLPESEKYSFSAPLYKTVCSVIPVKPPFSEPATYEVCYTTKKPVYLEIEDINDTIKPWSKIWNRKVSRRLFLSKSEVTVYADENESFLEVTIACLTPQNRLFWLLFRSKIGDFLILLEIKPKLIETPTSITGSYSWSPSATCLCLNGKKLPKQNSLNPSSCPFLTELRIPMRNDALWNALWTMFFKTLQPQEKPFWDEHFEMDIGICLLLWLISPDEEEEVIDEFIPVLLTRVNYNLKIESPNKTDVIIPSSIEILDVRQKSEISLPIHISKTASSNFNLKLTMTSENNKEIRSLAVHIVSEDIQEMETLP